MAAGFFFSKICQKSISLADIFKLHKCQVFAFINVSTTIKWQQRSGKFRIWKVLLVEQNTCYIFQNISRTKLVLIHEKIPDII